MFFPFLILCSIIYNILEAQQKQYYNFSGKELQDLLTDAKDGGQKSYNQLSSLIRSIAYSYFKSKYTYGKLNSLDDADDLANDVFLSFAKRYQNIDIIENWLRRVLFLTFVNFYKKQKSKNLLEYNDELYKNDKDKNDFSKFDSEKVLSILEKLKDPKDKIIRMRFWEGMQFNEIAEKLDRNEPAIKKMFYRAINEIKNQLE